MKTYEEFINEGSLEVANTIKQQMGGNKFVAMTGAKMFVGDKNSLAFRFPTSKKNKANYCKITLTPSDEYDMEFMSIRGTTVKKIDKIDGLQVSDIQNTFTVKTGLDTHL